MEKKKDKKFCTEKTCGEKKFPGVSADTSGGNKVTKQQVENDVSSLNNNPRNQGN